MAEQKLCTVCGTLGNTKRYMKGSILTELLLWCFVLIPGLIYSIWRHSTVAQVCGNCGSPAVIPLGSPVAQQVLANRGASSGQIQAPAPHSGAYALGAAARRAPTGKIAVGIIAGCLLITIISIAMNTRTPGNAAAQSTPEPSTLQAAAPMTPKVAKRTWHTGNVAQDRLAAFTESEQAAFLGEAVQEGCVGTRVFFMGTDHENDAFWSVGCANGQSYSVEIHPDSTGSTQVLECSVLKAVAGVTCFTKFAK
jgi:hypothetical protein